MERISVTSAAERKTTFACKHCGNMEVLENPFADQDELVITNTCSKCHDKAIVESALNSNYKNLCAVLEELNAWDFIKRDDGSYLNLESLYRFKFNVVDKHIKIWDENEQFNINADEEDTATLYSASKEFGFDYKKPESTIERIQSKLLEALKKDLKADDLVLEWEDGVVMSVWL